MDMSKVCRSCMKEVASWERENFNPRAVEMFCFCTNIMITEEDKLPQQFCYDCTIKIESSFTFITEAQKVNITLKNIISRALTSIIVEPTESHNKTIQNPVNNMKLTLPDYKISTSADDYYEPILSEEICNERSADIHHIDIDINKENALIQTKNDIATEELNTMSIDAGNGSENKKNICPVCRKMFTSKTWFDKHMEKEHTGRKYSCPHCSKTFAKKSQLKYHSTTHSDVRQFSCPEPDCGKRFKRRKQLACHARSHGDVRPYACDLCSRRFKLKSVLKCHMKVHEDTKQYLCYHCGWSFTQIGNLKVHMRIHTGEKPFSCTECGFRAAAASNLRRHQRRHRNAASHVCGTCRKGFYDASALTRHTRTHTGELPYQCPSCARAFADSWKRKTHLMRAHRRALAAIPRMRRDGQPAI
ncbi:zinc finger protein 771-like [Plodia interpunctella]|uniref:zinc finger protein 771-like n=1 Tax=Plodia interpunctella TaxID=58824 RepID=UPI002368845A|nr:zinc finger protein 771-like [Plodia interpunctella]